MMISIRAAQTTFLKTINIRTFTSKMCIPLQPVSPLPFAPQYRQLKQFNLHQYQSFRNDFKLHQYRSFRNDFKRPSSRVIPGTFQVAGNQSSNDLINWIRRRFNNGREEYIIYGIIAINVAVYLAWLYADQAAKTLRNYQPLKFMLKHFALSPQSSPFSYILCSMSHQNTIHLLINMFVLYSFGRGLVVSLGIGRFLSLYTISGLCSSVGSMYYKLQNNTSTPSLGASGKS